MITLREAVAALLLEVDLPEILLEIFVRTGFTDAFTHLTKATALADGLSTSLCAVLLVQACNTGPEPLIRYDVSALRRERLAWMDQNYLHDDTLAGTNALLVVAQNRVALAHAWGGAHRACRPQSQILRFQSGSIAMWPLDCFACWVIVSARAWLISAARAFGALIQTQTMVSSTRLPDTASPLAESRRTGMTCCVWPASSSWAEYPPRAS